MKRKRLKQTTASYCALIAVMVFFSQQCNAQFSIGVEAGYNKNYLNTNTSNLVSSQYNPLSGFSVGVPMLYEIADWFSIKTAPNFMQKNNQFARTGFYQGVYQNNTNSYAQLPVMGHFSFGGDALKGFVDLGGYAGYWLGGRVAGTMPVPLVNAAYTNTTSNAQPNNVFDEYTAYSYNEKYAFSTVKDKRLELGIVAGAGLSYQLNDTYQIFGEATYCESLTDQQKSYELQQVPRYNQTYVFSIGILYTLGSSGGY